MLLVLAAGGAEGIVRFPIRCHMRTQQCLELFDGLTLDKLAKSCLALGVEVGQLGDTNMREVLRAQSEEAPQLKIHRFHREFMGQIEVFVAEFREIALVECRLLIVFWHSLQFQQSRLTHEDGLYLEKVVAMVRHSIQRDVTGPLLEDIAIDAKAIVAGECHKIGILPRTVTQLHPMTYRLRFLFQAFRL